MLRQAISRATSDNVRGLLIVNSTYLDLHVSSTTAYRKESSGNRVGMNGVIFKVRNRLWHTVLRYDATLWCAIVFIANSAHPILRYWRVKIT